MSAGPHLSNCGGGVPVLLLRMHMCALTALGGRLFAGVLPAGLAGQFLPAPRLRIHRSSSLKQGRC